LNLFFLILNFFFFETLSECFLPCTVLEDTIKKIGHHAHKRDMMGHSYPIYA